MDFATITNIILCIMSFLLAVISVITVIATVKQNSKMIEGQSRAYVSIYGDFINCENISFYLIIKNFGKSNALITSLECDVDLKRFTYDENTVPFSHIKNTTIAPNQAFKCNLERISLFNSEISTINFEISYKCNNKIYSDTFCINLDTFKNIIRLRASTKNEELKIISYALQELDERLL